jgi:hypothetical protein
MITNEFLEQACNEVGAYSDEFMMAEFDRFFQEQPAICDFVVEATCESEPKIQELSLFLSYMVFKAMKFGATGDPQVVTPETIEAAYLESESWIERMSETENPEIEDPEPNLIQPDSVHYRRTE